MTTLDEIPVVKQVVSDPIFNEQTEAVVWTLGKPHPLAGSYVVVRMFIDRGGVEIYALSADGKKGMRNLVPMGKIRFVEEAMAFPVFSSELDEANFRMAPVGPLSIDDGGDDEDDDEPEPDTVGPQEEAESNGTSSATTS